MRSIVLIGLFSLLLVACATGRWCKPGATEADFNRDKYECEYQSQMMGLSATSTGYKPGASRGAAAGVWAGLNFQE
jgi:hypothetical protein